MEVKKPLRPRAAHDVVIKVEGTHIKPTLCILIMWNYKSRINVRDVTIDENRNVMEGDLGVRYRVFC